MYIIYANLCLAYILCVWLTVWAVFCVESVFFCLSKEHWLVSLITWHWQRRVTHPRRIEKVIKKKNTALTSRDELLQSRRKVWGGDLGSLRVQNVRHGVPPPGPAGLEEFLGYFLAISVLHYGHHSQHWNVLRSSLYNAIWGNKIFKKIQICKRIFLIATNFSSELSTMNWKFCVERDRLTEIDLLILHRKNLITYYFYLLRHYTLSSVFFFYFIFYVVSIFLLTNLTKICNRSYQLMPQLLMYYCHQDCIYL